MIRKKKEVFIYDTIDLPFSLALLNLFLKKNKDLWTKLVITYSAFIFS